MFKTESLDVTRKCLRNPLGNMTLALLFAVPLFGFFSTAGHSMEPKWPKGTYKYIVINQDARDVLIEFGRNINLPMQVSPDIAGRQIRGGLPELGAKAFLERLCDSYGLVWYFDGTVLHVNVDGELGTELIVLNSVKPETALRRLEQLGISDPRFSIRATEDAGVISVSGPPAYRSLVRKTITALEESLRPRPVREVKIDDYAKVRVFRGGS
jgi:type II secretory pathway component GspD/PulD (secretin)